MRNHNRRKKCKVAGPRKDNHPRGPSGPYSKVRAIRCPRTVSLGNTTDAVVHAKLRKRNRDVPQIASLANTIAFIKGCSNLDPIRAGAMVRVAGGTREEVTSIVIWTEAHRFSGSVSAPKTKPMLQQMAMSSAMSDSAPSGSNSDDWRLKCEQLRADNPRGSAGHKLGSESWEDYYYYLKNCFSV